MNRRMKWLLLLLAAVLAGGYAVVIGLAYKSPPLTAMGLATLKPAGSFVMAVDLRNETRWPITLTGAYVEEEPRAKLTAVVSIVDPNANFGYLASSVALSPQGNPYREGDVAGWSVNPTQPHQNFHGIRIELPLDTAPRRKTLVVAYRYLGWPLRTRANLDWLLPVTRG